MLNRNQSIYILQDIHTDVLPKKTIPTAYADQLDITTENSDQARELYTNACFGTQQEDGRIKLSPLETLYLLDTKRIQLCTTHNRPITTLQLTNRIRKHDKNLSTRYAVFKDLRNRGYIVKTALKFGADFRVYDRGIKPGEDHARWVVYPVHERTTLTWYDFSAKNRVAHSTKKNLLIGVADDEGDISYWEIRWIRP